MEESTSTADYNFIESETPFETIQRMEANLEQQVRDHFASVHGSKAEGADEIEGLRAQLKAQEAHFHEQLSELADLSFAGEGEVSALRNQLQEARAEFAQANRLHNTQLLAMSEEQAALEEKIAAAASKEERARKIIEEQQSRFHSESETHRFLKSNLADQTRQWELAVSYGKTRDQELAMLRESFERVETLATDANAKFNQSQAAFDIQSRDIRSYKESVDAAQAQTALAQAHAANVQRHNQSLENEVKQAHAAFEAQAAELNRAKHEVEAVNAVVREQSHSAMLRSQDLQEAREEARQANVRAESLAAILEETRQEMAKFEREAKSEIETLARENQTQKDVIIRQLSTLAKITKADKEKETEIQRHRIAEASLSQTVEEMRRAGDARDSLRLEFDAHIQRLNLQIAEKDMRIAALHSESFEGIQKADADLRAQKALLQTAAFEYDQMRVERDQLSSALKQRDDRNSIEREELQQTSFQLQQREYQLRHYAASVSDEKAEVLRRSTQLADEIRAASTLAPLKDYLKVTEFELSKAEVAFKKTPAISLDRSRLEASFQSLIEQRDFLRSAISNSQKVLDEQARALLRIARPEKLAPIPPLPPRKTSV